MPTNKLCAMPPASIWMHVSEICAPLAQLHRFALKHFPASGPSSSGRSRCGRRSGWSNHPLRAGRPRAALTEVRRSRRPKRRDPYRTRTIRPSYNRCRRCRGRSVCGSDMRHRRTADSESNSHSARNRNPPCTCFPSHTNSAGHRTASFGKRTAHPGRSRNR